MRFQRAFEDDDNVLAPSTSGAPAASSQMERKALGTDTGSQRARILVLLAASLALDSLDRGSIGAMAPTLENSLGFSNTRLGVLVAVVSVSSAIATLGAGVLVDSRRRTRILAWSLTFWVAAMASGAVASSYMFLLLSRLALGVVIATVGPASASLVGDLYRRDERGRIMGWLRSGEYLGIGIAFVIVSAVSWALSWRAVFLVLAVIGALAAVGMWRADEPPRTSTDVSSDMGADAIDELVEREQIEPDSSAVVLPDASDAMSLAGVVRYAVEVPTNRKLLIAEAIGDFALSGVAAFAVVFAVAQFDISQPAAALLLPIAGVGALLGLIGGSQAGDWLIRARDMLPGRLYVAGVGYLVVVAFVTPVLFIRSWYLALPLLVIAGAGLGASAPTVSAARLDVVAGRLWGRVEAVRTLIRATAVAAAPLIAGYLSDHLAGGGRTGLGLTIAIMLPLLAVNGVLVLLAARSYGSDVVAAQRSTR